jgi:hypothetical protein
MYFMLIILIVTLIVTFLSSAVILSKYIDFAKFMIDRKNTKECLSRQKYQDVQKIYIDREENIIIDVEAEEINTVMSYKILENKHVKG